MNVPIVLLGVIAAAAGIALLVIGRRRQMTRTATTGLAKTSVTEFIGIALTLGGLLSLARALERS